MISTVYYKNHHLVENVSLNSISQLLYLDRVGRADLSGCHLEEIWLFVTGLSHSNGNVGESTPGGNCWH